MDRLFVNLKKKLTPGVILTLSSGLYIYIYMYMTIIVKQVCWYIYQISGERLQDHWYSGCYCSAYGINLFDVESSTSIFAFDFY